MKFIKLFEELSTNDVDYNTLAVLIDNLKFRLGEYENYMVEDSDKLKSIEAKVILRELRNEFTDEFIKDLKIFSFVLNVNEILRQGNKHAKRLIQSKFNRYYEYLEEIKKNKLDIEFDEDEKIIDFTNVTRNEIQQSTVKNEEKLLSRSGFIISLNFAGN